MPLSTSIKSTYISLLSKPRSSMIRDATMCIYVDNIYIGNGRNIISSSPSRHKFRYIYRWLTCTLRNEDVEDRPARQVVRHQFSDTHNQYRRESNRDYQISLSVDTLTGSLYSVAPPPYLSPTT